MAVQLNHTIVWSHNQKKSAQFFTEILGLPEASVYGPFLVVEMSNAVSLDFYETDKDITSQHYAFLVTESEFDEIFNRIRQRGLNYWADPGQIQPGKINYRDGGKGVYFEDPDGHLLELMTRPYGSKQ
ncbi:TPA: VOC family protein [Legionella feeleii]